MGRNDVYLQPEASDPVHSATTILGLAARHTDRATALIDLDETGGEARAYLLTGDIVVKVQRPHRLRPRTSLEKEALILDLLATPMGAQVPQPLGYGRADVVDGPVEYLVMSRMPGQPVIRRPVDGPRRRTLLRELGALLRRLHNVPTDPLLPSLGDAQMDHGGTHLRQRLEAGFADLIDLLEQHPAWWSVPAAPHQVAAAALTMIPDQFTPVVLHSNPGPTHTFCTADAPLSGLIDFGDSYLSHPAMDLHRWPDPADRLTLREGYLHDTPSHDFDAAWTAAMIYTDMAIIASRPGLATAATDDLIARLDFQ
jgi:hygromycin-B 7''-O-kinase